MKRNALALILTILFVFALLPATAYADTTGFNSTEIAQLQAFLNTMSGDKTNGQWLNASYDQNDPSTWTGVTWNSDTVKQVQAIDFSGNGNLAGDLNLQGFTALNSLKVNGNKITSLEVAGDSYLIELICYDNQISSLNLTGLSRLRFLKCQNNNLTSLDTTVSGSNQLYVMNASGNKLTHIKAYFYNNTSKLIELIASGSGYVELSFNPDYYEVGSHTEGQITVQMTAEIIANAVPLAGHTFLGWSNGLTTPSITLAYNTAYSLTASFSSPAPASGSLSVTPGTSTLYVGGRGTLVPQVKGGTWQYDKSLVSVTPNADGSVTVKALKAGTASIHYTVGWADADVTITLKDRALPQTGQDFGPMFLLILAGAGATAAAVLLTAARRRKQNV